MTGWIIAFALAGLTLGVAAGAIPLFAAPLSPLLRLLAMIPPLAILPLLFIVFGLGELAKVMLIVIGVAPGQPPAQAVYVDGKKVGSGAVVTTKVTSGTHTVKWKWADGSASQKVTVAANEKKVVKGKKG